MFKSILFSTIVTANAKFAFPDNANFNMNFYNDSNCLNTSSHQSTIKTLCLEGESKCCNSLLQDVSFMSNPKFGQCYAFEMANRSFKSIKYSCALSKYQGMTDEEVFSFLGLFFLIVFLFALTSCVIFKCCCRRKGYSSV